MNESISVSLSVRPDTRAKASTLAHPDLVGYGYLKIGDHPADVELSGRLDDIRRVLALAITEVDTLRVAAHQAEIDAAQPAQRPSDTERPCSYCDSPDHARGTGLRPSCRPALVNDADAEKASA